MFAVNVVLKMQCLQFVTIGGVWPFKIIPDIAACPIGLTRCSVEKQPGIQKEEQPADGADQSDMPEIVAFGQAGNR